ncbi:hypothetical protein pipiens_017227 [Culex pipiens pipiens]|uniref:Transcription factor grauzone n=1 Tax=Culex pipiens pipiens TaxID=38569 RepID=A0ABD1CHJ6_CULPP
MSQIQEMCRICLHLKLEPDDTAAITDDEFQAKIQTVFSFELPADEPMPCRMCRSCCVKINEFYAFHEAVRSSQVQLQLMLSSGVGEEDVKQEQADSDLEEAKFDPEIKQEASESDSEDDRPLKGRQGKVGKGEKSKKLEDENRQIKEFFKLGCESCSECFESFDRLQRHTRKAHDARASIKCCNRVFYKKCKILEHINSHIDPNQFHCDVCNKSYNSKYYLDLHNLKMHSDDALPFKCEKCGRGFPKEYLLKSHLETHVQVVCSVCNKTLASSATLRSHMANMHNGGTKHICDTCGQEFRTKLAMDRHIKQHLGINPIERVQCHICSKWVNGKSNLKIHIRTVHNEDNQSVACEVCHQMYPNERALSSHRRRVHVEEKFECEFCGKKFKRSIYLKEHRASHTGQALYSCDVCGMTTNSNANLYSHKKNKHPEQWLEAKKKAMTAAYG